MAPRPFIPQANPVLGYLAHRQEIDEAIHRVLEGGRYIRGEECTQFESEFSAYLGARYAVGVANGTDALHLALRACGVCPGDWVITVSHTAVASVAAIEMCGAFPLLVDVQPNGLIDLDHLENALGEAGVKVKAIVPVHLYGCPVDIRGIMEIARRFGTKVVEDCAQAHGADVCGQKVGTWGDAAAFSFYPTKNLGAIGDGGAVISNDPEIISRVKLLSEYGWRERYVSEVAGFNSRLDEMQAAILRIKLRYLDQENEQRRRIARIYSERISAAAGISVLNQNPEGHVFHQYVLRCKERDGLQKWLKERQIGTLIHYPVPIHLQPAYQNKAMVGPGGLKTTEKLCQEILSLPIYPQLIHDDIADIANAVCEFSSLIP